MSVDLAAADEHAVQVDDGEVAINTQQPAAAELELPDHVVTVAEEKQDADNSAQQQEKGSNEDTSGNETTVNRLRLS